MSNDFILGSLAGVLFCVIVWLAICAISKVDFKKLKIKFKRENEYFLEILINLFINTFIILSVSDKLDIFRFPSYVTLIAILIISSRTAHSTFAKNEEWVGKLLTSVFANVGMFTFAMGLFCVIEGWKSASELLSYGSVLIAISSFAMMFFIAFLQLIDIKQKNKTEEN
ncbi:hypothetical protein ACULLL_12615 [Lysinibacillus irui]|uniref:hypothetical protein n=1 Tax=Lysinibacillus irui TaxID=2998077 RepID=UPI0040447176